MKHALLIIDAQQELIDGNGKEHAVYQKEALTSTINTVIEKAIQADATVVFIRDLDVANGEGTGFQIHRDIFIPADAVTFDKTATNSFYRTPLLTYLSENQIGHIVLMGCKTEHCVDTAVRTATINHFDVTLVEDGHSTVDSTALSAEAIISHHNTTLHGHYNVDHFSMVRHSTEELFSPLHNQYR